MKQPWMKFHPTDWRGELRLRACSLAARGLWIDLITYMTEGTPYGHLTIEGVAPDMKAMAALVGRPTAEVKKALAELEERGVFSRTAAGVIFSRRMVRDYRKSEEGRKAIARRWGEGTENTGPPNRVSGRSAEQEQPNTKKPEARSQNHLASLGGGARARNHPKTPLPENWTPDEKDRAYALGRHYSEAQIQAMAEGFSDHHRSHDSRMADWSAAWRTWVRNEPKFRGRGGQNGQDRSERSVGAAAERNAEQGFKFGPRPALVPAGGDQGALRLLPQGRGDRS